MAWVHKNRQVRFTPRKRPNGGHCAFPKCARNRHGHRRRTLFYSITSSARPSSVSGMSRFSAFAVFKLDEHFETRGPLGGEIGRFGPFQHLSGHDADFAVDHATILTAAALAVLAAIASSSATKQGTGCPSTHGDTPTDCGFSWAGNVNSGS